MAKKLIKCYIYLIIALILFLVSCVLFIVTGYGKELLTTTEEMLLNILFIITSMPVIIACYFDGKKDGAIEQYKLGLKKEK